MAAVDDGTVSAAVLALWQKRTDGKPTWEIKKTWLATLREHMGTTSRHVRIAADDDASDEVILAEAAEEVLKGASVALKSAKGTSSLLADASHHLVDLVPILKEVSRGRRKGTSVAAILAFDTVTVHHIKLLQVRAHAHTRKLDAAFRRKGSLTAPSGSVDGGWGMGDGGSPCCSPCKRHYARAEAAQQNSSGIKKQIQKERHHAPMLRLQPDAIPGSCRQCTSNGSRPGRRAADTTSSWGALTPFNAQI